MCLLLTLLFNLFILNWDIMNVITMHYCGDMCQILCFVLPGALLPIDKESPYLNKEYYKVR